MGQARRLASRPEQWEVIGLERSICHLAPVLKRPIWQPGTAWPTGGWDGTTQAQKRGADTVPGLLLSLPPELLAHLLTGPHSVD